MPILSNPTLSQREQQVLDLAADGMTDLAIGAHLGIKLSTVSSYWMRIRSKLGPFSRSELVAKSIRRKDERVLSRLREVNERLAAEVARLSSMRDPVIRSIFEAAPDGIIVFAPDARIETANAYAAQIFGYPLEQFLRLSVEDLVPEAYMEDHVAWREEYRQQASRHQMGNHLGTPARHAEGFHFPINAALAPLEGGRTLCFVRDMRAETYAEIPGTELDG